MESMHVLVIEDNPDLVANLYDYLEGKGHSVDAANEAHTGLQFALENHYDALVLDLMLPGMDGLEVCAKLREEGRELPVLMLTARDALNDKLEGFANGADDYMVKPFALQELEVRLNALVRRARGETTRRTLTVGDLSFDQDTLNVLRSGKKIVLPPIPLKILGLLMRQSPRVMTRQEIEREIWGDTPPDSDALRAHMHLLRAAIDKPFDSALLRTLHGIGYQLVDSDALQA